MIVNKLSCSCGIIFYNETPRYSPFGTELSDIGIGKEIQEHVKMGHKTTFQSYEL